MKDQRALLKQEYTDFLEQVDKWSVFILANLMWVVLAIPLVTIPIATLGLFAVMSLKVRGKQPELFQEFFGAIRRLWRKATVIGLIDALIIAVLVINISVLPRMELTSNPVALISGSATVFISVSLIMVNFYLWSLLVIFEDSSIRSLIENAVRLTFAYPIWSFGILFASLIPISISLILPQAALVIFTFSATVMVINMGTWRVIRRHLSDDERQTLEAPPKPVKG